jgi:hypothetical protein
MKRCLKDSTTEFEAFGGLFLSQCLEHHSSHLHQTKGHLPNQIHLQKYYLVL